MERMREERRIVWWFSFRLDDEWWRWWMCQSYQLHYVHCSIDEDDDDGCDAVEMINYRRSCYADVWNQSFDRSVCTHFPMRNVRRNHGNSNRTDRCHLDQLKSQYCKLRINEINQRQYIYQCDVEPLRKRFPNMELHFLDSNDPNSPSVQTSSIVANCYNL